MCILSLFKTSKKFCARSLRFVFCDNSAIFKYQGDGIQFDIAHERQIFTVNKLNSSIAPIFLDQITDLWIWL